MPNVTTAEQKRRWKRDNREHVHQYNLDYRRKNRLRALDAYGSVCQCCGESRYEFLSIDHIDGNGKAHRKQIGGDLYGWLRRNNYPVGFRTLCHNCNMAIGFYGACPHRGPQ